MDKVFIKGMSFFAKHGVLPHEQETGQRFLVDVTLYQEEKDWTTADISDTIDYKAVYQKIEEVVTGSSFKLIESLAEMIAKTLLENFALGKVKVCVRKPHAPLEGYFETLGVKIKRKAAKKSEGEQQA